MPSHIPPTETLEKLLDTDQAAKLLNIHPDTLRQHAASGNIPAIKLGRRWRFIEKDLVQHLHSLYAERALQGVNNQRRKTLWHSTKEMVRGGLTSVTTAEEYAEALKPPSKRKHNGSMTS